MSNKEYESFKLKNGLKIILIPLVKNMVNDKNCLKNNKYINNIGINLFIPVGSRHEDKNNSGISHILEHASFRQNFDKNISIMRKLQINGSIFNAETSLEYTHYYVISDSKFIDDDIKIMSKILLDLEYNVNEIEKEKRVILEEYFLGKDNVKKMLIESIFRLLVDKNHPINKPVIGTFQNIKNVTVKNIVNFKKKHYNTNTATIVISGNFDKKEILTKINNYFNIERRGDIIFPVPINLKSDGLKIKTIEKKGFNHVYLCLGFKSINLYNKEKYIYDVLSQILKNKLFLALRDDNGLTYTSNVVSNYNSDFGLLGILSSVISVYVYKTIYVMLSVLYSLKTENINKIELASAITTILNGNNVELSSVLNHNTIYGFQSLYNIKNIETPKEYLANINSVTIKDILTVAKKLFKVNNMLFVSVGDLNNNVNLKKLLNLLKN